MKLLFIIALLVLPFTAFTYSEHAPHCQPKTSDKAYKDSLFVFVVDPGQFLVKKSRHWYFLKQLACATPIADNIRNFVLDYSSGAFSGSVKTENLVTSQNIIATLYAGFQHDPDVSALCSRFENTISKFITQNIVKSHKNVHMFVPIISLDCSFPNDGNFTFHPIVFISQQLGKTRFSVDGFNGVFDTNATIPTSSLVDATRSIIEAAITLQDTTQQLSTNAKKESCKNTIIIILSICGSVVAAMLIFLVIFLMLFVKGRLRISKLKRRLIDKEAAKKTEKDNNEDVIKPRKDPILRQRGQSVEDWDKVILETPTELLCLSDRLKKMALENPAPY